MEIRNERQVNGMTNSGFPHPDYTDELDSIGGEPLESSGFEEETPEPDFEEGQ